MTQALLTALVSAALAALGGFTTGAALRAHDYRREKRVAIYLDHLPACRSAIAAYAAGVRKEGSIASMAFDDVVERLRGIHRAAMVASRQDEAHTRALAWAARDLDRASMRWTHGHPRRAREGGWGKLAWDTITQAESALFDYETWLERRLLGPRPMRQATRYESIEIDRDLDGEDVTRFSRPAALSTDVLSNLLRMPIVSWAVLTGVPIEGRVLVIWMRDLDQRVMQRLIETDDDWLYPIGNVPDEEFPDLWRIAAHLDSSVAVPSERQAQSATIVIADYPVPPHVHAELTSHQVQRVRRHAHGSHDDASS